MTPAVPTWGEIKQFLNIDGWRETKGHERGGSRSRHIFWEKDLPSGETLQTHISHSLAKRPGARAFALMLQTQIKVSRNDFWNGLATGDPVDRPVEPDEAVVEHPAWVVEVLATKLYMSPNKIEALSAEEALRLVNDYYSRPKD